MITEIVALAAVVISAIGFARLTARDPKRSRAFGLTLPNETGRAGAWALVYMPGLILLIVDQWAAAMMWLGGAPLAGWAISVTPPETYRRWGARLRSGRAIANDWATSLRERGGAFGLPARRGIATSKAAPDLRIEELEQRVVALEAALADAKREASGNAIGMQAQSEAAAAPLPRVALSKG